MIVANPHGITCQGCGFINTPRATLTTGKPIMDGQRLERFQVDGGDIVVEGAELNVGNLEQFDLITRSAKLNAKLSTRRTSTSSPAATTSRPTACRPRRAPADGSEKPELAIDSSALGGMYAGAIRLVGTEQGRGGEAGRRHGRQRRRHPHRRQRQAEPGPGLQPGRPEDRGPGRGAERQDLRRWQRRDPQRGELVNRQSLAARERIALEAAHIDNAG
ncbi:hypothetical protein [Pseudomonas aeruginosa]|uniref:two-partner secretion domain-containing protein n=1 Tax=Pseudomonas aeruginosa TaxID=287 RepID=UPI002FEE251D